MRRLLELFCGTKSVSKVAEQENWEILSVDIMKKFQPDICCDILLWDYKQFPPGYFDFVWASPPCIEFSKAKTIGVRNLELANKLVLKAKEIIHYFQPPYYCIENPVGLLRRQEHMANMIEYRKTVSYCKYGFAYQKNTDLWTNVPFEPLKCELPNQCAVKRATGKHPCTVQMGYRAGMPEIKGTTRMRERYSLPSLLVRDLLAAAE